MLNIPDSPDLLLQCVTDPRQWADAQWRATAFLCDLRPDTTVAPAIGLAFRNFKAGKQIFDDWIKRFGHIDAFEELRISIIEGPLPSTHESGPAPASRHASLATANDYTVFISSNLLNTIKRKQQNAPQFDPKYYIRSAQMNTMSPTPDSPNLRLFKQGFARLKRYRLFPASFDGSQLRDIDLARYIEKRELNFLHTSGLKPHQPEHAILDRPRS